MTPAIADTLALLRRALTSHRYRVRSEADLQDQVASVLGHPHSSRFHIDREVISSSGRYDLQVRHCMNAQTTVTVVLELKTRCAAAAVERQAQRYAMTHGVDAVCVVTTSPRLARQLADLSELGGKPFAVIKLRAW